MSTQMVTSRMQTSSMSTRKDCITFPVLMKFSIPSLHDILYFQKGFMPPLPIDIAPTVQKQPSSQHVIGFWTARLYQQALADFPYQPLTLTAPVENEQASD